MDMVKNVEKAISDALDSRSKEIPALSVKTCFDCEPCVTGKCSCVTTLARAAILAMREPTAEMYEALVNSGKMWGEQNSLSVWQTFIDAALAETRPSRVSEETGG